MPTDNRFVFVAPVYNASETLEQMILSIVGQSYKNWKLVMVDDVSSPDETVAHQATVQKYRWLIGDQVGRPSKIVYDQNHIKRWEVFNVLRGILRHCDDKQDIICRIDGDDWLTDLDILHVINQRYNEKDIDALWTAHRWSFTDGNISGSVPPCEDVYEIGWRSSHLKTFRRHLIDAVPLENFLGEDGKLIKRAGDQAIYLPVLHNAKGKFHYEPRVGYHYSIELSNKDLFSCEDSKFQKTEAEYIRDRGYVSEGTRWQDYVQKELDEEQ